MGKHKTKRLPLDFVWSNCIIIRSTLAKRGNTKLDSDILIQRATSDDAPEIAAMVVELLTEIMRAAGIQAFRFNFDDTLTRLEDFIQREKYFVFIARNSCKSGVGFAALTETQALYAEGVFGIVTEFYVRPDYRSQNVGHNLLSQAKMFASMRGWKRLEVTTPPLPPFDRTLAFYQREGFEITGGRKLKLPL